MNKTLRTFIIIAAMLIATGQSWAALTRISQELYVESATGGTVTLHDNAECTGDAITHGTPGSTVYIKVTPDAVHGYPTVDMITAEKIVDSGVAQSRGTKRVAGTGIGLGEYVTVAAVGQSTGIFSFTMPNDGTSVSIAVTFPDVPISYINAAGQAVDTGNVPVHILTGSETELDAGWYVADGTLDYSQPINLFGDVHLILLDDAVMNVDTEESPISGYGISGSDYTFSIYAQSTGDGMGQLHINATSGGIFLLGDVTICGGQVTANGSHTGIYTSGNLTISGGRVTANGGTNGIYAGGNITLGWTSLTDFVQASSYFVRGTVSIADDKAFAVYDGETITSYLRSGTLTDEKVEALADMTLRPVTTIPAVAPQNLTVSNVTDTEATLTWEPGDVETQWQVAYSTDGGTTWSDAETVTETTYTMTGLPAGTSVTVRVRSFYNDDYSDFATSTFTTASSLSSVEYLDAEGHTQPCTYYTVLDGSETELDAGWYVAEGTLNYSEEITLNGDVHLILKDGAVMNIGTEQQPLDEYYGIYAYGHSLSIYAQSTDDGKGKLNLNLYSERSNASGIYISGGNLTINGGQVTTGSYYGFRIEGSSTINGGEVTGEGDYLFKINGNLTINGGEVTDEGQSGFNISGNLTINGGQVTVYHFISVDYGTLTLGWTSLTDFIRASYSLNNASFVIAEGKPFAVYAGNGSFMSYLSSGKQSDDLYLGLGSTTLRPVKVIPVEYVDGSGTTKQCSDYTLLKGNETELSAGWYVAKGTLNYSQAIALSGDVHLILQNGAVVNIGTEQTPIDGNECISGNGHSLSIYAQSNGGGQLNLYAISPSNSPEGETLPVAGIRMENGNLTINGGEVTATGPITMDGGTLTLGWASLTDFIKAPSYQLTGNASVAIAEGKAFKVYDGESLVEFLGSGTLTSEQVAALGGTTLRPSRTTLVAPQNLVASMTLANTLTSARLMWQNDGEATSWQLATSTDGGTTWSDDVTVTAPAYSVTTELTEGSALTVRVRSVYSATLCSDYATKTFNALSPVDYIDAEGNSQSCSAYTTLTGMETSIGIPTNTEGITSPNDLVYEDSWYLASGYVDYVAGLALEGNVHLILADDALVSFYESDEAQTTGMPYSIYGLPAKLNIYGQQAGSGVIDVENPVMTFGLTVNGGALSAHCKKGLNTQGAINVVGDFTVNGGVVYAESDNIGIATMEMMGQSTNITINGGKVTAFGRNNGFWSDGDIIINGGVVKGYSGENNLFANRNITINGGQVTASNAVFNDLDGEDQDSDHSINLWALGDITLGWSKASDFIQADKYYTQDGTVSIAEGKTFCDDDGNTYSGTQTFTPNPNPDPDDIYTLGTYAIDGKMLRPDLVRNLKATVADGVVTLSWTGSKESYNVRYRETSAEEWTVVNVATRTYTPSGLTDDALYVCQVQGDGEAEWSNTVYFMPVVTYIGEDGSTQRCSTYTAITGAETSIGIPVNTVGITSEDELVLEDSWYVAFGKTDYGNRISMNGNVHLILADDAEVNFAVDNLIGDLYEMFFIWAVPCNLTIYGQSEGTGTINSNGFVMVGGDFTVNGGTLNVTTEYFIEMGAISVNGRFIVNGGNVFAQNPGMAIYAEPEDNAGIIINGGQVTAVSRGVALYSEDDIIINGGQVTAQLIETDMSEIELKEKGGMLAKGGNITLGATKASDFILATRYVASGTLTIADGTTLYDEDGNAYSGTQTLIANPDAKPDDIFTAGTYAIDGKTLRPAANVTIAIGGAGVRTYASPYDLDFTGIEGLTAYVATSISGSTLTLTPVDYVPAGTGLMLKGTANTSFTVPLTNDAFAIDNNLLVGLTEATLVYQNAPDGIAFILANGSHGINWYRLAEDSYTLKANSAYLRLPADQAPANGARLTLVFEDNATTGVDEMRNGNDEMRNGNDEMRNGAWYTLDGMKLDKRPTRKGLYIHNGRKEVVK